MLERETGLSLVLLKEAGAEPARWTPLSMLALRLGISRGHAAKLAQRLVARGFMATRQGVTGGVMLTAQGREASFLDVATALEDPFLSGGCFLSNRSCNLATPCHLHEDWLASRKRLLRSLARTRVVEPPSAVAASSQAPSDRARRTTDATAADE